MYWISLVIDRQAGKETIALHDPVLLRQVVRRDPGSREAAPLVNVPASLIAAAVLIVVAYLASGKVTALEIGRASCRERV